MIFSLGKYNDLKVNVLKAGLILVRGAKLIINIILIGVGRLSLFSLRFLIFKMSAV